MSQALFGVFTIAVLLAAAFGFCYLPKNFRAYARILVGFLLLALLWLTNEFEGTVFKLIIWLFILIGMVQAVRHLLVNKRDRAELVP